MDEQEIEAGIKFNEQERKRAIARIRDKTTGIGSEDCVDCGDPIDVARRIAAPSARRCITCQQDFERKPSGFTRS